ncbi:hypothetical protein ACUNV4_03050 [Granulosicoccus sp. 3-233]|uniref:hypothetical protein n=1 Tax=Granulosicoccus sp. 3-233 TaxID=3417969 RepID=UPI003D344BAB
MFGSDKSECRGTARRGMGVWPWLLLLCLFALPGHAQSPDTTAPLIEVEELNDVVADRTQVFTVRVEEDNELQEVTLYHRRAGVLPYTAAPMQPVGETGYYSVSIPTDYLDLRTIEYYVKAGDQNGNRTVSGFAFDPYRRTLKEATFPLPAADSSPLALETPASQADETTPPLLQRRWVQITLGVLAVGVLANLASDSGEETRIVPLTFTLE